jgi:hypothetical protein
MVCLLSLGSSHLVALMAAHRASVARSPAQSDALRRCDGTVRLDRLVFLDARGDNLAAARLDTTARRSELTRQGRPPDN